MKNLLFILILFSSVYVNAQDQSKTWIADQGNGMYKNPVLHADYSDPDAIRVGDDFYMTASSFEDVPGLPILHSKDLVNWKLIGHALPRLIPVNHFSVPRHGEGVWAPSIRYHNNEFYIYYPDPDFGIYLTKAKHPSGPWSEPILVEGGKGLIDPCPLWVDNGDAYLVHAYAGSRAGIKSIIVVKKMNSEGTKVIDQGKLVYDGHEVDPTIEGPKFYKRNGYYYIFAPAGGVSTGWQTVLRSKNVYGPYERKVVMHQGSTKINGPHQGAWVNTPTGEDWFLHFQDKEAYGRIVHLQPMKWVADWPVIGEDRDGDGIGEPVAIYKKPGIKTNNIIFAPPETDDFNEAELGLQWQWMANPEAWWYFLNPAKGQLRLYAVRPPAEAINLWGVGNILLQKFPAPAFSMTTKLSFSPNSKLQGEKTGLAVMGLSYAAFYLESSVDGLQLVYAICNDADKSNLESRRIISKQIKGDIYLRVTVKEGGLCSFGYSKDGITFMNSGEIFTATPGKWKGAKAGIFCSGQQPSNDAGYADFEWFRVEPLNP